MPDPFKPTPTGSQLFKPAGQNVTYSYNAPVRPLGVTLIALLNYAQAFTSLGLLLIAVISQLRNSTQDDLFWYFMRSYSPLLVGMAILGIALGLSVATGLWLLQWWGYKLALFSYVFTMIGFILLAVEKPLSGLTLATLLVSLVIIMYLAQAHVREAFQ